MPQVVLHVFDKTSGIELDKSKVDDSNVRVFSYNTDHVLNDNDFILEGTPENIIKLDPLRIGRVGKTLGQDFKDRNTALKVLAQDGNNCDLDNCTWCKGCFNLVAIETGENTI